METARKRERTSRDRERGTVIKEVLERVMINWSRGRGRKSRDREMEVEGQ